MVLGMTIGICISKLIRHKNKHESLGWLVIVFAWAFMFINLADQVGAFNQLKKEINARN
jgi:hypothetical protein